MQTAYRLIVLCGVGFFLSLLLPLSVGPTLLQSAVMLICLLGLVCALFASSIIGLVKWRKSSRWWMGSALLCIAFILIYMICGRFGILANRNAWHLKHHMDNYVRIVDSIKSGATHCDPRRTLINTTNLPPHIRNIIAARCPDGSVFVEFYGTGSSFAGHTGYLFKDYTDTNNCFADDTKPEHYWHLNHITGNWYTFSD